MAAKVVKCDRCKKRMRNAENWNVVFNQGVVTGYVCPDCQTGLEEAEAKIYEALTDYSSHRTVKPSDPDYMEAVARHILAVLDQVFIEYMQQVAAGAAVEFDPYALADLALDRITAVKPVDRDQQRENLAQILRETMDEALNDYEGQGN